MNSTASISPPPTGIGSDATQSALRAVVVPAAPDAELTVPTAAEVLPPIG